MSKIKAWAEMMDELAQEVACETTEIEYRRPTFEEEYLRASREQIGGNHYSKLKIQPIDYIMENGLGYLEGNVIKYVTRHKDKNGVEDIEKAIHYLELIKEKTYGK